MENVVLSIKKGKKWFHVNMMMHGISIKDLLLSKGVTDWRMFTVFPIGRAKDHKELQLGPVQFKQLFDYIAKERKKGDIKLSYGCEGYLGNYEGEVRVVV